MTAALTPRVRMMTMCDGVRESKIESGVYDLKGVRQSIDQQLFPFAPRRLRLFLLLSCHRIGEFPCYVRVVHDRTAKSIYYAHIEPPPQFTAPGDMCVCALPIRCVFPEPGRYTVEISFFQ